MRLIDLDASAKFSKSDLSDDDDETETDERENSGLKFSSGYVPPELIYCNDLVATVRSPHCKNIFVNKWIATSYFQSINGMDNHGSGSGIGSGIGSGNGNGVGGGNGTVEGMLQRDDSMDEEEQNVELDFDYVPAAPGTIPLLYIRRQQHIHIYIFNSLECMSHRLCL
jgi:hypothetical protein